MKEAKEHRLPLVTTPKELGTYWSKILTYGNKIVMAGNFSERPGKPHYFGAAYEFTTDDQSAEGEIQLTAISGLEFMDDGHAIAWAMQA